MISGEDPANMATPWGFTPLRLSGPTGATSLANLIARMLELDPANRPASATQVKQELQHIASGQPPPLMLPPQSPAGDGNRQVPQNIPASTPTPPLVVTTITGAEIDAVRTSSKNVYTPNMQKLIFDATDSQRIEQQQRLLALRGDNRMFFALVALGLGQGRELPSILKEMPTTDYPPPPDHMKKFHEEWILRAMPTIDFAQLPQDRVNKLLEEMRLRGKVQPYQVPDAATGKNIFLQILQEETTYLRQVLDIEVADFTLQADLTSTLGLVFRLNKQIGICYEFEFQWSPSAPAIHYELHLLQTRSLLTGSFLTEPTKGKVLLSGVSKALPSREQVAYETPLIAIVAQGTTLDLYVNLQHLARVEDDSLDRGIIGIHSGNSGYPLSLLDLRVTQIWIP